MMQVKQVSKCFLAFMQIYNKNAYFQQKKFKKLYVFICYYYSWLLCLQSEDLIKSHQLSFEYILIKAYRDKTIPHLYAKTKGLLF